MIKKEILPIGSVVLLKNSERKVMVMGLLQGNPAHLDKVYDYCGCLYPEGYMDANNIFLFDEEQIEEICFKGFDAEEQAEFRNRVTEALPQVYAQYEQPQNNT